MTSFNDFEWHDAVIQTINIDRTNPGNNDTIRFTILWPDNSISDIVFEDVYRSSFDMNFGIIALESIDIAFAEKDTDCHKAFYAKWKGRMDDVDLVLYPMLS